MKTYFIAIISFLLPIICMAQEPNYQHRDSTKFEKFINLYGVVIEDDIIHLDEAVNGNKNHRLNSKSEVHKVTIGEVTRYFLSFNVTNEIEYRTFVEYHDLLELRKGVAELKSRVKNTKKFINDVEYKFVTVDGFVVGLNVDVEVISRSSAHYAYYIQLYQKIPESRMKISNFESVENTLDLAIKLIEVDMGADAKENQTTKKEEKVNNKAI